MDVKFSTEVLGHLGILMGLQGSGYKWRHPRMIEVICMWIDPLYTKTNKTSKQTNPDTLLWSYADSSTDYQAMRNPGTDYLGSSVCQCRSQNFFCKKPRDEESCRGRLSAYSGRRPQKVLSSVYLDRLDFELGTCQDFTQLRLLQEAINKKNL